MVNYSNQSLTLLVMKTIGNIRKNNKNEKKISMSDFTRIGQRYELEWDRT